MIFKYGHQPKEKWVSLNKTKKKKNNKTTERLCITESSFECIRSCVVRCYLLFALARVSPFLFVYSPFLLVSEHRKNQNNTEIGIEQEKNNKIKTNPKSNVLVWRDRFRFNKLCENFIIYWSFEVQPFPYHSKLNVVRIDFSKPKNERKRERKYKTKHRIDFIFILASFSFGDSKHR